MKAIILAAGRGSRLGSITDEHPKCLTELAGKPLLHWQLAALKAGGISEIAIVTGYRKEVLEGMSGFSFHNADWAQTNMVMSLAQAASWLEATPCLVSYSDIVYGPEVVRSLMATQGSLVISFDRLWEDLWRLRFEDPLSDAETFRIDDAGRLLEIGEKPGSVAEVQGQYMGLLKITPQSWARISAHLEELAPEQRNRLDMTALLSRLLSAGEQIDTCPVDGGWCEVDDQEDLSAYQQKIRSGQTWSHDWRGGL